MSYFEISFSGDSTHDFFFHRGSATSERVWADFCFHIYVAASCAFCVLCDPETIGDGENDRDWGVAKVICVFELCIVAVLSANLLLALYALRYPAKPLPSSPVKKPGQVPKAGGDTVPVHTNIQTETILLLPRPIQNPASALPALACELAVAGYTIHRPACGKHVCVVVDVDDAADAESESDAGVGV
ncbi:hypothetical protein BDP27DRAFT_1419770 [Rhodocollybia butyracea]|uniref:Uncharacterized protein n=1 Tax=Rhodocollybia butyracea TaxID=206335 RepID=A0A9P5PRA5_9AGAR|nr:hypothetical protein BDP27DRAFT_1419770 [Rhodocollybia butyracea]